MEGKEISPALALRLALAGAWQAVRGRRLGHFPRVLRLLRGVAGAAPGALRCRHWARLRLGLGAAAVMWMLQQRLPQGLLFEALDSFFPEGQGRDQDPWQLQATPQDQARMEEAEDNFREQVLRLLRDPQQRETYLEGPLQEEYGEPYLEALELLFHDCLQRLESCLPPPDLQLLQKVVWSHAPPGPRPSGLPTLIRYLLDLGHTQWAAISRPILKNLPSVATPYKPRPRTRRLLPLEFEENPGGRLRKKVRFQDPSDPDREGDRNRHRAHGQGGADQGEGGGEGRDPPPAAEADLQRQADERREDRSRLQDPGGLSPAPGAGPAGGRGRGRTLRRGRGSPRYPSPRGTGGAGHAQR